MYGDYSRINQAEAERLTHEIQTALEQGDDQRATELADEPRFVALCARLDTTPVIALERLREQAEGG